MTLNCVHNKHIKHMAHLTASIYQWDSQTTNSAVERNLSLSMSLAINIFQHITQVCNEEQLSEIRVQNRWLPKLAMSHLFHCIVLDYKMIDNVVVYFLISYSGELDYQTSACSFVLTPIQWTITTIRWMFELIIIHTLHFVRYYNKYSCITCHSMSFHGFIEWWLDLIQAKDSWRKHCECGQHDHRPMPKELTLSKSILNKMKHFILYQFGMTSNDAVSEQFDSPNLAKTTKLVIYCVASHHSPMGVAELCGQLTLMYKVPYQLHSRKRCVPNLMPHSDDKTWDTANSHNC